MGDKPTCHSRMKPHYNRRQHNHSNTPYTQIQCPETTSLLPSWCWALAWRAGGRPKDLTPKDLTCEPTAHTVLVGMHSDQLLMAGDWLEQSKETFIPLRSASLYLSSKRENRTQRANATEHRPALSPRLHSHSTRGLSSTRGRSLDVKQPLKLEGGARWRWVGRGTKRGGETKNVWVDVEKKKNATLSYLQPSHVLHGKAANTKGRGLGDPIDIACDDKLAKRGERGHLGRGRMGHDGDGNVL